jgi:hypothetical protein
MTLAGQLQDDGNCNDAVDSSTMHEEAAKLVSIIEARLRATLLSLVQNSVASNKTRYVDIRRKSASFHELRQAPRRKLQ